VGRKDRRHSKRPSRRKSRPRSPRSKSRYPQNTQKKNNKKKTPLTRESTESGEKIIENKAELGGEIIRKDWGQRSQNPRKAKEKRGDPIKLKENKCRPRFKSNEVRQRGPLKKGRRQTERKSFKGRRRNAEKQTMPSAGQVRGRVAHDQDSDPEADKVCRRVFSRKSG